MDNNFAITILKLIWIKIQEKPT